MKELIRDLGGYIAVADGLGIPPKRVSNWGARGVPYAFRNQVARLAVTKGIAVPAGFLDPPQREHAVAA
jgi:hypothetical protein